MFVNRAQPPPPRFGKFISTARCKALQSLYCTIRRLFVLFVDYSRTIRTIRRLFALFVDYSRTIRIIRRLFADYSHYSSTIRGLFVLFVDYSHYSHYSLHYSSFINCRFFWDFSEREVRRLEMDFFVKLTRNKQFC